MGAGSSDVAYGAEGEAVAEENVEPSRCFVAIAVAPSTLLGFRTGPVSPTKRECYVHGNERVVSA